MRTTALVLFAAGAAWLLATAGRSHSTPPAVTGYNPQTFAAPVVVPYYGATYGGDPGASKAQADEVLDLLRKIEANTRPVAGPLAAPKRPLDRLAVAKQRCLGCHTEAKADAKGGGFILFADEQGKALKPLSGREKTRITEAVQGGTMPPGGKLSADEKAAFQW